LSKKRRFTSYGTLGRFEAPGATSTNPASSCQCLGCGR